MSARSFSGVLLVSLWMLHSGCNLSGKPKQGSASVNGSRLLVYTEYLDRMVLESSGLIWFQDRLWTINDSGGEPVLFSIDTHTGKCIQAVYIEGATNRDWEELAQDEDFIYILDIGNNYGRRDELTVYRVAKDSIPAAGNARIHPDIIRYRYGGKEKNNGYFARSPFDCEAAIAWQDSLYLFTKDWENLQTDLYVCPASPGTYTLRRAATFEADGLVTGAAISPDDSSHIILIGYKDYVPFVWEWRGFDYGNYTVRSMRRLDFPEYYDLQTEGVAFRGDAKIFVSSEMSSWPASVYTLDLGDPAR